MNFKNIPFFLLLFIYIILPSFLFFSILHYSSFPLFYTILPYRLTFITLPFPLSSTLPSFSLFYNILLSLHPTLPFLLSNLHCPSFSSPSSTNCPSHFYLTLPFLLSLRHYLSFSLSYTTLPFLILYYPSFSSPS